MNPTSIPLLSMLRGRMGYLSERQKVIAQNVANADTPRYAAEDLTPFRFEAKSKVKSVGTPATTHASHLQVGGSRSASGIDFKTRKTPGSEITLNGNSVVLEEEMIKMSGARMNYDAAIGFYQKSMNLLRLATKAPGRG